MPPRANEVFYATSYHPIQAGSIDGTDTARHDNGIRRALIARASGLYDPTGDCKAQGDPYCTIFVGRLSRSTTEETLREVMSKYGKIKSMRLVRHIVTGASRGYAFVEFENEKDYLHAYEAAHQINIDGNNIVVDYNRQQLMSGWIPRRFGGGLGGRKESGQLRFGGRDRPFRAPLRENIPLEELKKLDIPEPSNFMSRYQIPPPPRREREHKSRDGNERRHSHDDAPHRKKSRHGDDDQRDERSKKSRHGDDDQGDERSKKSRHGDDDQRGDRSKKSRHGDDDQRGDRSKKSRHGDDARDSRRRHDDYEHRKDDHSHYRRDRDEERPRPYRSTERTSKRSRDDT